MSKSSTRVAAEDLLPDLPWEAKVYLGPVSRALRRHRGQHLRLAAAAKEVFEGVRPAGSAQEAGDTLYRQADLRPFEIVAGRILSPPASASLAHRWGRQALLPGDVVINKLAPVRAALVCESTANVAVDWSCLVVRGLSPREAAWLLVCLNREDYAGHLFAVSGGAVLRRIGLKALRELRLPPPPSDFDAFVHALLDTVAERARLRQNLQALQLQVEKTVASLLPSDATKNGQSAAPSGRAGHWVRPSAFGDSWVPDHVLSAAVADKLQRGFGWKAATRFLVPGSADRGRMSSRDRSPVRLLRLRDADEGVFMSLPTREEVPAVPARVYARAVQPAEVLLSTLATAPSVVFAWGEAVACVHPVDHWERLRFTETAGAFALVLACPSVQRQFVQLTTGLTRQFLRPEAVRDLLLPTVDEGMRRQWHTSLLALADLWDRELLRWRDLQETAGRFYRQQHRGEAT